MSERIHEPSGVVVRARPDVRASRRSERNRHYYFLEDPLRGTYYRLGEAEFALFQALDGVRTLEDAVAKASGERRDDALNLDQALALVRWLLESGLACTGESLAADRLQGKREFARQSAWKRWNLWFVRVTFGSPDRWIERLRPAAAIVFGREFFALWLCTMTAAMFVLLGNWTAITSHSPLELGFRGSITLMAVWCGLKLLHEFGHALACRHVGDRVGDVGVMFVLGIPSPFVDVSSVWRRSHRGDRMLVTLAGVYLETFVAASAILVWSWSGDEATRQLCLATAFVAGVSTLVFNLNPLMRFDGYFALADAVDVANLSSRSAARAARWLRYYLLGADEPEAVRAAGPEPRWLTIYGLAAMAWRGFVTFGLLSLALYKFGPIAAGLLSLFPAARWIRGAWRTIRDTCASTRITLRPRRAAMSWSWPVLAGAALLWWCDPRTIEVAGVVDYEPLVVVRAPGAGFVREVFVNDGDVVAAGQPLVRIENEELAVDLAQTKLGIQQQIAKARIHRQAGELAKEQAEVIRRQALEVKLAELEKRSAGQIIVAPTRGRIVSRGAAQLAGRWLSEGSDVVAVGTESAKQLVAALSQEYSETIDTMGDDARLSIAGYEAMIVPVSLRGDPRATRTLLHPALAVEHGGSIPVRRRDTSTKSTDVEKTMVAEFHKPYFRLTAGLSSEAAESIRAGRTATLQIRTTWRIAISRVWSRLDHWLNRQDRDEAE